MLAQKAEEARRKEGESDFCYGFRPGLKLDLFPTPYMGDIKNAKLVICMLNPGFSFADLRDHRDPGLRSALKKNLRQDFHHDKKDEFRFPFLDPQFCWTSGFNYWYRRFHPLIKELTTRKKENGECWEKKEAMRCIANQTAVVELFPYNSKNFDTNNKSLGCPSVAKAKAWFRETRDNPNRNKLIVLCRGAKKWGLETDKQDKPECVSSKKKPDYPNENNPMRRGYISCDKKLIVLGTDFARNGSFLGSESDKSGFDQQRYKLIKNAIL